MRKPPNYWADIQNCKSAALQCVSRRDFEKKFGGAYNACLKHGWMDDVCGHMMPTQRLDNWTKAECHEVALTCKSRKELKEHNYACYIAIYKNKWHDELFFHMSRLGNKELRYVYEIADHDKKVIYIGLTENPQKRLNSHRRNSAKLIKEFGNDFEMKLISELLPSNEAANLEKLTVSHYKFLQYKVLNGKVVGQLGSNRNKWCVTSVTELASSCETRREFKAKHNGAYQWAANRNMLDTLFPDTIKPPDWDFEACRICALKCTSRSQFIREYGSAYAAARRNGWLDEICSHMEYLQLPNNYWSFERAREICLSCDNLTSFRKDYPTLSAICYQRGWNTELFAHMKKRKSPSKRT